jgi:hypothetical protein
MDSFNQTLAIYLENSPELLFIHNFKLQVSAIGRLNNLGEKFLVSSLLGSLIVGSYFKSSLYRYLYENYKECKNRPINILILLQAIIEHLACLLLVANYTIGLSFDITFSEYLGETWCNVPWYGATIGAVYRNIGSLGIAIFRVMLIKFSHKFTEKIKQNILFAAVLALTFLFSIGLIIGWGMGNGEVSRKQVTWNFCTGRSEEYREVMHNYSLLVGSVNSDSDIAPRISVLVSLLSVMAEFICYLLIFSHLYFHDKYMLKRKLLSVDQVNRRNQKNAVAFLGQFYGFVVECVLYFTAMYLVFKENSNISYRAALAFCFWAEFGVVSIVEVMASNNLRRYLPHNWYFP